MQTKSPFTADLEYLAKNEKMLWGLPMITEEQISAYITIAEDAMLEWFRGSAEDRHKTPLARVQMRAVLEAFEKNKLCES